MRRLPQPDPADVEPETLYCFGCGRRIGVTPEVKMAVFCEELCWHKDQLIGIETAARNRAFGYLIEHSGLTVTAVSDAFGVSRALINQVLAQSNDGYLAVGRKAATTDATREARSRAGKLGGASRWSDARK